MGFVSGEAAVSLGLRAGTPVATGWTDGMCTMLGTGIYGDPGVAFLSSGTSDVVGNVAPGAATGGIDVLEAPAPGNRKVSLGQSQTGGASLLWFARKFADGDVERVLEMAASVAPGAGGLVFLPYLQGERAPIWDDRARGVFFGITMEHGPAEFARSLLEGVAACDRHLVDSVARSSGQPIERLRPAGGARGGLWIQIKADMLERSLELTSEQPATLGAAMLGGVAAGVWPDLESATRDAVRVTGTIEPNPANRAVYDRLYETYVALYPRVKDLFPR
jgi:sugar (pentulose or hexulose) kinase